MDKDTIEKRVELVLQAQEVIKKLRDEGLIKPSYKAMIAAAMNTAMRLTREDTEGNKQ